MRRLAVRAATTAAWCVLLVAQSAPAAAANRPPQPGVLAPAASTTNPRLLTARVTDADGWRDIRVVRLRLRESGSPAIALQVQYRADAGAFSLFDRGAWHGALRPGAAAAVASDAGRLYARHCRATGAGTALTLRWFLGLKAPLEDRTFLVELRARDCAGAWSPWRQAGTWRVDSPQVLPFPVLPADNPWNTDISRYHVHPDSATYIASIGAGTGLHPDFGTEWEGSPIGIPYARIGAAQPAVPISFSYPDESDPGPYPIPPDAPIEGGPFASGDRHILLLDVEGLVLHEVYDARRVAGGWSAGSGARFDLTSNALRPDGWTSADAAGLPIFPGLVRYEEAQAGVIPHALRFTASRTRRRYIHPATHFASASDDAALPPMGLRVRLKAGYNISGFPPRVRAILQALKTYGMLLADNGSDWFVSGAPNENWDDEELGLLREVKGSDFEAVFTGPLLP